MISNKPLISIPRGTVCLAAKAIQQSDLTNDAKPPAQLNSGGSTMTTSDGRSLMSEPMGAFIAGIAKCCDEAQIGMSHKEVIQLMKILTLATTKQCDNHFDYLVRMKKILSLKIMVEFRGRKRRQPNAHESKWNSSSNGTMKLRVFGRIIKQLISLLKNIKSCSHSSRLT